MFEFKVQDRILKVDEKLSFKILFKSTILGEFSETFRWQLEGTKDLLTLTFKGHVIAPTFQPSLEKIDFDVISYRFTEKQVFQIENTSKVDFMYTLHIPGDKEGEEKEFEIEPISAIIKS